MLLLSRQVGESIAIDLPEGLVRVTVLEIAGGQARLGVSAPREVSIDREEVRTARLAHLAGTTGPGNPGTGSKRGASPAASPGHPESEGPRMDD